MNVSVVVIDRTERGVQVSLGGDADAFWLPRNHPAVVWSRMPEPGETVTVKLPAWLTDKHRQLAVLRFQRSLSLHEPLPGLNPAKAAREGSFPMANDTPRGALFRIPDDEKKNDKWPDYRGDLLIEGIKWRLAGWVKTDKNGKKYLSLVAKLPEERTDDSQQQRPAGGQSFVDRDIPFGPDR